MSHYLFILVCPSLVDVDQKVKAKYTVLFTENADLPGYTEYVLYFQEKTEEDSINAWCTDNVPMSWYVEPLY